MPSAVYTFKGVLSDVGVEIRIQLVYQFGNESVVNNILVRCRN